MSDDRTIRFGLIGAGRRGRFIIDALSEVGQARLVRVATSNPETAERVPSDCRLIPDWRDLMNPTALDGVIVASPPATHAEMVREALTAGLPILVEPPLAMTTEDAVALRRLAGMGGAAVMIDHTLLAHPGYRFLKELVATGTMGPIRAIRIYSGGQGPYTPDLPVLWHRGAQDVALCIDLLDASPDEVRARLSDSRPVGTGRGEVIDLRLEFGEDVDVRIRLSNRLPQSTRIVAVHCEKLSVVFDPLAVRALTVHAPLANLGLPEDDGQAVELGAENATATVLRAFAFAIAAGEADDASLRLGLDVTAVLARCQAALDEAAAGTGDHAPSA